MQGAVAFRPDGRYAYVAVIGANALAVIGMSTLSIARMIRTGTQPWGVLVLNAPQQANPEPTRTAHGPSLQGDGVEIEAQALRQSLVTNCQVAPFGWTRKLGLWRSS